MPRVDDVMDSLDVTTADTSCQTFTEQRFRSICAMIIDPLCAAQVGAPHSAVAPARPAQQPLAVPRLLHRCFRSPNPLRPPSPYLTASWRRASPWCSWPAEAGTSSCRLTACCHHHCVRPPQCTLILQLHVSRDSRPKEDWISDVQRVNVEKPLAPSMQ